MGTWPEWLATRRTRPDGHVLDAVHLGAEVLAVEHARRVASAYFAHCGSRPNGSTPGGPERQRDPRHAARRSSRRAGARATRRRVCSAGPRAGAQSAGAARAARHGVDAGERARRMPRESRAARSARSATRRPRGRHYGRRARGVQRRYARGRARLASSAAARAGRRDRRRGAVESVSARRALARAGVAARALSRCGCRAGALARDGYLAGGDARRGGGAARGAARRRGRRPSSRRAAATERCASSTRCRGTRSRARPKWIVGFSDVTALHAMAWRAGVASVHAPNVTGLGRGCAAAVARVAGSPRSSDPRRARSWRGPARRSRRARRAEPSSAATSRSCTRWRRRGGSSIPEGAVLALEDVTRGAVSRSTAC